MGQSRMITVDELKQAINLRIQAYLTQDYPMVNRSVEKVELDAACGRVLAQEIVAHLDIPRQNLSAMDGFAFAAGSTLNSGSVLEIVGESCAGTPFTDKLQVNQGVRIFTGAVVPSACDTVVMQENTNFADIKATLDKSQSYSILLTKDGQRAANIRYKGEEIRTGDILLNKGKRLNPSDISLLASMGYANILVFEPLVVGIIATGDELVTIGSALDNLAKIYNSNTPTLKALLSKLPITIKDYGITNDTLADTKRTVQQAIDECDIIISSAGVSVGDYDFLTQVVDEIGQINHYKVAMKPGKPFVFGEFHRQGRTVLYFGLPGNPLSTVVGCINFVRPALWQALGAIDPPQTLRLTAQSANAIKKNIGRCEYQRGHFKQTPTGFVVSSATTQDSHRIKQLSQANCLIVLDEACAGVSEGDLVNIEIFDWVI